MNNKSADQPTGWEEAASLIRHSRTLGAVCHERPDGDAIGSMLGFTHAAAAHGKTIRLGIPAPGALSDNYRFLPLGLLRPPLTVRSSPDTLLVFDCGDVSRLGNLAGVAERCDNVIVVDHHTSNTGFGTVNIIEPGAAATAQLVVRLLDHLRWAIDKTAATCLLTGITTDSGRFQYSVTSPETHRVAARLVEAGARPEVIGQRLFQEEPFGLLRVAGAVLSRARLDTDLGLVWSELRSRDLHQVRVAVEDTERLIDLVRLPREADVAMLVREEPGGGHRVSLRSRGRRDVASVAVALGGGGHHNAAGFRYPGTAAGAVRVVKRLLAVRQPAGRENPSNGRATRPPALSARRRS